MAVDARGVRLEERLRIKIGEAKNLPARSHGTTHRDTYCVLSLDQEEIFRTSTVERSLNPYFGEEFQFEVPRGFRYLSIYVYDRDRQYKQDKVLGKVAIKREELKNYDLDHWFALQPVDADSEVQGKAHIEILFEDSHPKITTLSPEDEPVSDSPRLSPCGNCDDESHSCSSSIDRKNFRTRNLSKNISDYCRGNVKFGSYSSTSSRKYFAAVNENVVVSLGRSESLRSGHSSTGNSQCCGSGSSKMRLMKKRVNSTDCQESFVQHKNRSESFEAHQSIGSEHSGTVGSIDGNYLSAEISPIESSHYVVQQYDLKNKLSVRVLECSELTLKNGQCDPYAEVTVYYKSGKRLSKKTKCKKKTVNPKFDEVFVFDLDSASSKEKENSGNNTYTISPVTSWVDVILEVVVSLWHDTFFLGEVRLPLQTPEQKALLNTSAWYLLGSRSSSNSGSSEYQQIRRFTPSGTQFSNVTSASLGSLRLLLHHTVDRILPSPAYDHLKDLLLKLPPFKPVTSSAVYVLGEIITNKSDIAQPLVRLFMHADCLVPVIRALADAELATLTDPTTIFRGNTLVSKMMDEAMRLIGLSYLRQTLRPTVELIFSERKQCEIDPIRVKEPSIIEANLANLKDYVDKMFTAITQSFIHCPAIMCRLFDALRQCAAQKFPRDAGVRYSVVSGFIFLRFFAPAILSPRLYDLTTEQIDSQTQSSNNRTLTLISKMIQTLGNSVSSKSSQQYCKEDYMADLYGHFCTEVHVKAIKQFLEIISTSSETQNSNIQDTPVLLKEGIMIKRAQKQKRLLGANLKKRHFQLTSCELSYSKARGKKALCSIPLAEIVAVESVSEVQNLKMKNMFQIVYKDNIQRVLYIQANNCVERKEWLDLLGKLCEGNRVGSKQYHPSSFLHGHWDCCSAAREDAPGCAMVSTKSPSAGIHLRLDPTRDLQRIHCLLYKNISLIESLSQKLEKDNASITSYDSKTEELLAHRKTLKDIKRVTFSLEDQHRVYQRNLDRETKYGSKQAPIGDDNYLLLASRNSDITARSPMKHSQSAHDTGFTHMSGSGMYQMRVTRSIPLPMVTMSPKSFPRSMKSTKPPMPLQTTSSFDSANMENIRMGDLKMPPHKRKEVDTSDAYLNNSLYIGSSEESLKNTTDIDRKLSDNTAESGYLKMSVKNDLDSVPPSVPMKNPIRSIDDRPPFLFGNAASISEYVQVKPHTLEKDGRKKPALSEANTDSLQNYSQEYDLLSDFTSFNKKLTVNKEDDSSTDIPPAVPPRSLNTTAPTFTRYYKKSQIPSLCRTVNSRHITDHELKNLDHCQVKTKHVYNENQPKLITRSSNYEAVAFNDKISNTRKNDNSYLDLSPKKSTEVRSHNVELIIEKNLLHCAENSEPVSHFSPTADVTSDETESVNIKSGSENIVKDNERNPFNFFSRKSFQRESNSSKSKTTANKSENIKESSSSSSSSTANSRGDDDQTEDTKSKSSYSNRPSFLKKKTKVDADTVCLPTIC